MKLTKEQLKKLVEEVILEEIVGKDTDLVNEERLLEEGFADIMQKMRSSGRSAIRGFMRKSANSKANRKIEAAKELNIKIINQSEWLRLINKTG